jgi:uncharacterized protein YodC (DUF2158 family)
MAISGGMNLGMVRKIWLRRKVEARAGFSRQIELIL